MQRIVLSGNLETITFEKAHSQADEWRVRSTQNNGGATNLNTEDVQKQVEYLKENGFKQL